MLLANGRKLDTQDPAAVQQTAAQLASELFFKPLLGEMRQFPLGRALTDGGQGGAVFGSSSISAWRTACRGDASAHGQTDAVLPGI